MSVLQRLALRGTPKATKQAARYTPAGGAERCGMCRHYVPSSSCARIEGPVTAAGWCQLYSQQVTWRPRAGQDAGLNPGGVPAAGLDLSFMTPGSLDGRITFTRASTATYADATGTMQSAAANAPRWDYNPTTLTLNGLLIEEARTNIIKNSTMVGGAAGSPGTDPTGWSVATIGGLTKTVVGIGTANGIPYVDYRFNAAAATAGNLNFIMSASGTSGLPVIANTVYTMASNIAFVAGSFSGIGGGLTSANLNQYNASGTSLGTLFVDRVGLMLFTIGDPLGKNRVAYTFAATASTAAFVQPFMRMGVAAGPVDFTVRIGGTQIEAASLATSYHPDVDCGCHAGREVCCHADQHMVQRSRQLAGGRLHAAQEPQPIRHTGA